MGSLLYFVYTINFFFLLASCFLEHVFLDPMRVIHKYACLLIGEQLSKVHSKFLEFKGDTFSKHNLIFMG